MTKKDYILIAEVLKDTNASDKTKDEMARALHLASGYTPNGNKSFDANRFLLACNELEKCDGKHKTTKELFECPECEQHFRAN